MPTPMGCSEKYLDICFHWRFIKNDIISANPNGPTYRRHSNQE
jgi:hypothetical protein